MFFLPPPEKKKGTQETLEGDGHVYYLDCGSGFIGIYICLNSSTEYVIYVQYFCKSVIIQ